MTHTRVLTIPEKFTQSYEWMTRIITGRDGTEQRIALRTIPRQTFRVEHLADSEEIIQSWKNLFVTSLISGGVSLPIWSEAERATTATNIVTGDFSFMDDSLATSGLLILMVHPDGETYEERSVVSKSSTEIEVSGSWAVDYPEGSVVVPLESVFVQNNSGYSPSIQNVAAVPIVATAVRNKVITGEGAPALSTYNSRTLLDKQYQPGGNETFTKKIERIDFGHKIAVDNEQPYANITSGRSYLSSGNADRQFWKLFLQTQRGPQIAFYTPTYRHDMTVTTQPSASGTTFDIDDSAPVAGNGGWENISSHLHLALQMADGTTLYREIDPGPTIDNGDGTHTVAVTVAFPAAPEPQHTITKVSFLELVRIASDTVEVEHFHEHRVVKLPLRTIIE